MVINGTIVGNVFASGYLEIAGTAKIFGDLHYSTIEIHGGSHISGRLVAEQTERSTAEKGISSKKTGEGI